MQRIAIVGIGGLFPGTDSPPDDQSGQHLDEFWKILSEGDHRTVVHAGRQEICFSIDAIDTVPRSQSNWVAMGLNMMAKDSMMPYMIKLKLSPANTITQP